MRNYKNYGSRAQGGFAWIPAAIGAIASLVGGRKANVASAKQAQRQMDFQREMSNTAHQREVRDLRAAGLNPILSGTGGSGASTPGGAMAPQHDIISPAVSSAMQQRRLTQEIKNMKATELTAVSQAHANAARAALSTAQTAVLAVPAQIGEAAAGALQLRRETGVRLRDFFNATAKSLLESLGELGPTPTRDIATGKGRVGIRRPDGSIHWSDN